MAELSNKLKSQMAGLSSGGEINKPNIDYGTAQGAVGNAGQLTANLRNKINQSTGGGLLKQGQVPQNNNYQRFAPLFRQQANPNIVNVPDPVHAQVLNSTGNRAMYNVGHAVNQGELIDLGGGQYQTRRGQNLTAHQAMMAGYGDPYGEGFAHPQDLYTWGITNQAEIDDANRRNKGLSPYIWTQLEPQANYQDWLGVKDGYF